MPDPINLTELRKRAEAVTAEPDMLSFYVRATDLLALIDTAEAAIAYCLEDDDYNRLRETLTRYTQEPN